MEFNGFIRRIDSLGRIVIPKEIRNSLKIKRDDCLEISSFDEKIVLTKKSLLKNYNSLIEPLIDIMSKSCDSNIIITDVDKILYCNGSLTKKLLNLELTPDICDLILKRKTSVKENSNLMGFEQISYILSPIIINGDAVGSIITLRDGVKTDFRDEFCIEIIKGLIIKNLEV